MKDMFDWLDDYDFLHDYIYIVKIIKNKKKQKKKIYYLETISQDSRVTWTLNIEEAINLSSIDILSYNTIRDTIRNYRISCQIYRTPVPIITKPKVEPVKKTWWGRFKVWFSRKFEEFMTTPIDSSLP